MGAFELGEPVDVTADMTRLTLDTIALCGFGYRFNSFYRDTLHPFVEAMYGVLGESPRRARELPIETAAARCFEEAGRELSHGERSSTDHRRASPQREYRRSQGSAQPHVDKVDKKTGERLSDDNIVVQC